jgi:hypothetical protein
VQAAAHEVVVDGRALAVQPRGEEHAAAARRRLRGEPHELAIAGVARAGHERVAEPLERRPGGLLLAGDEVATRQRRRQRGDAVQRVRALERHVTREPGRRAEVEVRRVVEHRARADGRGHRVRRAAHDGHAQGEAEIGRRARRERPEHAARRQQLGQLPALDSGRRQQAPVVAHVGEVARVGQPVERRGDGGGGGPARQAQRQVVDRLEERGGAPVDVGPLALQVEQVPERVAPGEARRAAREPEPTPGAQWPVAGDPRRAAGGAARVRRPAAVEPGERVHERLAVAVDRHRAGPLARDGDGRERARREVAERQPSRGGHDARPALARALLGAAARQRAQRGALELAGQHLAVERYEPDLGAARPEVDGEHLPHRASGGAPTLAPRPRRAVPRAGSGRARAPPRRRPTSRSRGPAAAPPRRPAAWRPA